MMPDNVQKPARRGSSLLRLLVRNQWLMADQALVSGMNFLTTATLARMLGVHNFGVFSVFYFGDKLHWDHFASFGCLIAGAFFMFHKF